MNTEPNTPAIATTDRRRFLKKLAVTSGALALAPAAAMACNTGRRRRHPRYHAKSFRLDAKGRGRFDDITGFYWPFPPKADLTWASYEMQMKFPYEECDLLHLQVFLLPPAAQTFFPDTPPGPVLISDSLTEIEEITVGPPVYYPADKGEPVLKRPKPTFALMGRVVENEIASPFGAMIGKIALFSAAFDHEGDNVRFYLLGGMIAGQHATFLRPFQETPGGPFEHARGSIHFRGY